MKRVLLSSIMGLALTSAQAGVAINSTNFPDENMLWAMQAIDDNGEAWGHNGILDDEEIAATNDYFLSLSGVANFKGIEYFYDGLKHLIIIGLNDPEVPTTNLDITQFKVLETIEIGGLPDITSLDFTNSPNLTSLYMNTLPSLTTVQIPASMEYLTMYWCPNLTTVNLAACHENLNELHMQDVGIKDVDVSNFKKLHRIYIEGNSAEEIYKLNSLNIAGCDELWSISIQCTDIESVTIKDLPEFNEATVSYNDIRKLTVENCPKLLFLDCQDNKLPELHIKKCDKFWRIFASNNYMRTLIIDESPLEEIEAANNLLMWLDLSQVVYEEERLQDAQAPIKVDDQHPSITAYKLSATEVGFVAHERMDPARMLNLRANGKTITPVEKKVDNIRYIVFYDDGVHAENILGDKTTYKYETKWPYPWIEGNSEDNNLPVALNVTKVEKPASFIKVAPATLKVALGSTPTQPTVTRSDGYDGALTYSSSNEDVVKVNATTGALTLVAVGEATITITGAATDYRNAPTSVTYKVEVVEQLDYTLGDANGDGSVDIADAVAIVNYVVSKPNTTFNVAAADANGDNEVDIADAVHIVNFVVGKIPALSR